MENKMGNKNNEITKWREANGVIYFSVTSDGTTGPQWIKRLKKRTYRVGKYTKSVLRSNDFKPTNGVMTEIAVLKGILFKEDGRRTTSHLRTEANKRKFTAPNAEVACLICEMFTDEDLEAMDLYWIVTMHKPISPSGRGPMLLNAYRNDEGHGLYAYHTGPGNTAWGHCGGFAFVVS